MLDFIRTHKRLMLIFLALFIVPGLGLMSIQGFRDFFRKDISVARVSGHPIRREEYETVLRDMLAKIKQMSGETPSAEEMPAIRKAVLEDLIEQRMLAAEAQRTHLTVSDPTVRKTILSIPAIAPLIQSDGSIDLKQYRALLAAQGLTPGQLEAHVRRALTTAQIYQSIAASAFISEYAVRHLSHVLDQQREIQVRMFRPRDYQTKVQQVSLDDPSLRLYYDAHQSEFEVPEAATVHYVILSAEALAKTFSPSKAELKKAYQAKIAHVSHASRVRARHILLARPSQSSTEARQKALEKARAVLAQVRAQPEKFAEIARQYSQDPGSAKQGGDLGYFSAGMMVKPFEEAAFKLKKNEVSDLIETEYGYHIIQVTDLQPATVEPFDVMKAHISDELKKQYGTRTFSKAAEQFSNLVYERNEPLEAVASKFGLESRTAEVTRQPNPSLAAADPLNQANFLAAVFDQDVLNGTSNTAAIAVGNDTLIAARVTHYQPVAHPPFESVKHNIQQKIITQRTIEAARKASKAQFETLQKTHATEGFSPTFKVSRTRPLENIPPAALEAIFKADTQKLPQYVSVALAPAADGGFAIYRINAVSTPPEEAQNLVLRRQQLAQMAGQFEWNAYLASLRARSKVKINLKEARS